ncbi:hypothetical protein DFH27DRAFT_380329 [Peziza echinospora]|nr:hypothetical protein DFH27DRAFT_380329 [Peziza echinospora]
MFKLMFRKAERAGSIYREFRPISAVGAREADGMGGGWGRGVCASVCECGGCVCQMLGRPEWKHLGVIPASALLSIYLSWQPVTPVACLDASISALYYASYPSTSSANFPYLAFACSSLRAPAPSAHPAGSDIRDSMPKSWAVLNRRGCGALASAAVNEALCVLRRPGLARRSAPHPQGEHTSPVRSLFDALRDVGIAGGGVASQRQAEKDAPVQCSPNVKQEHVRHSVGRVRLPTSRLHFSIRPLQSRELHMYSILRDIAAQALEEEVHRRWRRSGGGGRGAQHSSSWRSRRVHAKFGKVQRGGFWASMMDIPADFRWHFLALA